MQSPISQNDQDHFARNQVSGQSHHDKEQVPYENRYRGLMQGLDTQNPVYAISRSGWIQEKPLY